MTSVERLRLATGIVIGDGSGAAVSAATCAGERICCAPIQPATVTRTSAVAATAARRAVRDTGAMVSAP